MRVAAHGFALEVPTGWEVRIRQRPADSKAVGSAPRPVLHAATVPMPEDRGDFGGGVTGLLGRSDLFFSLFDYGPEPCSTRLFADRGRPSPTSSDFSARALQRTIPGQSGRQWFFQEDGRALCLYVVLGSHAGRAALVTRKLRPVLSTLELGAVS